MVVNVKELSQKRKKSLLSIEVIPENKKNCIFITIRIICLKKSIWDL